MTAHTNSTRTPRQTDRIAIPNDGVRYCGRFFTTAEIEFIRHLLVTEPDLNRHTLSRRVCDKLRWLRPDGRLKDMSCRVAMLRMERDHLITLPAPQNRNGNGNTRPKLTEISAPRQTLSVPAGALGELVFRQITTKADSNLWNQLIERYHYLGHKPLPGAQIRYLVESDAASGSHLVGILGFGAAAWKVAPRDKFIGWTIAQRERNLRFIVNNARFLIPPWITSKNLASRILSGAAKRLPQDWQTCYGHAPVLLETFVQQDRFKGTCYRAANWTHVGQTQGRGKLDRNNEHALPVKDIFVYPLRRDFARRLSS